MGVIPERLKSLENVGLLRYGIGPWQQNDNILRLSENNELSDSFTNRIALFVFMPSIHVKLIINLMAIAFLISDFPPQAMLAFSAFFDFCHGHCFGV